MAGKIQSRLALLAALAALVAVALVMPASGQTVGEGEPTDLPNEGVLRLELGSQDRFVFQPWDESTSNYGPATQVQNIGPPLNCELKGDRAVNGPLAKLSAIQGNVGMDGDDIGIRVNGARGVPCGQVENSEEPLRIELYNDEDDTTTNDILADLEIDYAEIDLEGKHDVAVAVEAFLDGQSLGAPVEVFNCETDADCGPDSADLDNFRVIIAVAGQPSETGADAVFPGVFDRLDFYVSSANGGDFSLNGGSDQTMAGPLGAFLGTFDTVLHLTDVETLDCGVPKDFGDTDELGGTVLLANCDGSKPVAYTSDEDNNEVTLTNVGPAITDSYTLERWSFLPQPQSANPLLRYDDGNGEFVAPLCLIDPRGPGFSVPDGLDTDTILPLNGETPAPDDRHTTCVIEDTRTVSIGLIVFDDNVGAEAAVSLDAVLFSIGDFGRGYK